MARTRIFKTTLSLAVDTGDLRELSLTIAYDFTPAFAGSYDEPAHGAAAEVEQVRLWNDATELAVPPWLVQIVETDQALLDALIADAAEQDASDFADAEERRAEDRAERLREEA